MKKFQNLYVILGLFCLFSETSAQFGGTKCSYLAALLIFAGVFSSCNRTADYEISDIDSRINIEMMEILDVSTRRLELHCSTARTYPQTCYGIAYELKQSSNNIDIKYKHIVFNKRCWGDQVGVADCIINLGMLSPGTYRLNLSIRDDIKYQGELIVTPDDFQINNIENSEFSFTNNPLGKIPKNTLWGKIGYNYTEGLESIHSFITALVGLGAIEQKFVMGNYGEFEIGENGQIVQPVNYSDLEYINGILFDKNGNTILPINVNNTGLAFAQSFIFYFSGNFTDAEQLAKDYVDYLSIRLFSDKGERY